MLSLWSSATRASNPQRLCRLCLTAAVIFVVLLGAGAAKSATLAGTWSPTASMSTVRYAHTATLLPHGKVLVAGGYDASNTPLASAELFNPATGQWTPTGDMNVARVFATATLLPNGKVLVAGGADASAQDISSAEVYDPTTGTWSLTGSMQHGRFLHEAQLLRNGKVLVFGGYQQATQVEAPSTELYDPSSGAWTEVGDMNNLHADFFSAILPTGRVLAAGGCGIAACPGFITPTAETYNPSTGSWTETSDLVAARTAATMTTLPNGQAFVAGGIGDFWVPLASAELYNKGTGTWTLAAPMSVGREDPIQALLPTGQVLVAGGSDGSQRLASSEVYDPSTNTWRPAGAMNVGRSTGATVVLADGQVLVTGGFDESNVGTSSAEIFSVLPTSKGQCQHGGWTVFTTLPFKNQGDCFKYVTSEGLTPTTPASAKLTRTPVACMRRPFTAHINGLGIATVTWWVDGRRIRGRSVHRGTTYAASVSLTSGRHQLTARVTFVASSHAVPRTFRKIVKGCSPPFTGLG